MSGSEERKPAESQLKEGRQKKREKRKSWEKVMLKVDRSTKAMSRRKTRKKSAPSRESPFPTQ